MDSLITIRSTPLLLLIPNICTLEMSPTGRCKHLTKINIASMRATC